MRPVGFAVIGIKGMGKGHIEAINKVEEAQLAAVCDIDAEAAKACGEEQDVPWVQEYHDLFEMDGIDVVDIVTPHYLHAPMAIDAMQAGRHVFCEKPMSISVSEADEMVSVARSTGRTLGICHNHRPSPSIRLARRLIEEGVLGRITNVLWTACGLRTQAYYNSGEWRGTWEQEGGGVLINQAIHDLDTLHHLLGEAARVSGRMRGLFHDTEVEDLASAIIEFKSGATCVFQATLVNAPGAGRKEFYGDKATLILGEEIRLGKPEIPAGEFIRTNPEIWATPEVTWETLEPEEGESGHVAMVRDFAKAVRDGREPMATGADASHAVELCNAIILSSLTERTVELPLDREEYDRLLGDLRAGEIGL